MNNKGFTLVEILAVLVVLSIIVVMVIFISKGTLSSSQTQIDTINENEIYNAATLYIIDNKVSWKLNNGIDYTCITVKDIASNGYFEYTKIESIKDKIIRIEKDHQTNVTLSVKYVDNCN